MTIHDDDLRKYSSQAVDIWLGSIEPPLDEHEFSRRFRHKLWLSRFHAYRLYYMGPLKRVLRGIGVFLLLCLLVLAVMPFEQRASDISFIKNADSLTIRIDDSFEMEENIITSLLMPRIAPMKEADRTIEVDDISLLFGEDGPSLLSIGDTAELAGRMRLSVIAEMDFYDGEEYLGTIEVVTPRDKTSITDSKELHSWQTFRRCGSHYICFHRGEIYFTFYPRTIVEDNLEAILYGK